MATYTGDLLEKLRKQDLIPVALFLQSKVEDKDNAVLEDVCKRKESTPKLHAELAVTKNVNNLLLTRLSTLERQCWEYANIQEENVLISWAFLVKCLEKLCRRKFQKYLSKLVVIFLLIVLRRAIVLIEQLIQQLLSFLNERTASTSGALRKI